MEKPSEDTQETTRRSRRGIKTPTSRLLVTLVFLFCSPVLIPLSILSFPIVLLLVVRWTRRRDLAETRSPPPKAAIDAGVPLLLDRYLDDQMVLVRDRAEFERVDDTRCGN